VFWSEAGSRFVSRFSFASFAGFVFCFVSFLLLLNFLFRVGRVEVFCGSFQEQSHILEIFTGSCFTSSRIVFDYQSYSDRGSSCVFFFFRVETDPVTIVLHFTVGRTTGAFISEGPNSAEQGQEEIRFLPHYRYLCQVRTVHAPLSVCACVGNWVFWTLLGLSCVEVRSKAKGAWGWRRWRPCSSSSFSRSLAVSSGSVRSGASSQNSNRVKIAKSCHAALNPTYFCCSPSLASRFSLRMILEYLFSTCLMSVPTSAIQFALYCPVKKTHLTRFWKSATMTRDALMLDSEITEYEQHLVY
jgi:hypothetical protein